MKKHPRKLGLSKITIARLGEAHGGISSAPSIVVCTGPCTAGGCSANCTGQTQCNCTLGFSCVCTQYCGPV